MCIPSQATKIHTRLALLVSLCLHKTERKAADSLRPHSCPILLRWPTSPPQLLLPPATASHLRVGPPPRRRRSRHRCTEPPRLRVSFRWERRWPQPPRAPTGQVSGVSYLFVTIVVCQLRGDHLPAAPVSYYKGYCQTWEFVINCIYQIPTASCPQKTCDNFLSLTSWFRWTRSNWIYLTQVELITKRSLLITVADFLDNLIAYSFNDCF
jgi:hypothetical protein